MLGSAASLIGLGLILLVLTLWMCVKIWRRSPLLAIGTFLFSPLAILALILYWKDEEADIKLPFFLSLGFSLLLWVMAMRTVDMGFEEMAWFLSDQDIAEIRANDPAMATRLEDARARMIAKRGEPDYEAYGYDDADSGVEPQRRARRTRTEAAPEQAPAPREPTPVEVEAQQRAELEMAAQALSWRFGVLDLDPAPATLHVPRDFRFVPRVQVSRVARLRGTPVENDVIGWLVHRQVDLARDDAWYVQVRFVATSTRLSPPVTVGNKSTDADAQAHFATLIASQLRTAAMPSQPMWNGAQRLASWQWLGEDPDDAYRDHVAALPLRGGVLEFSVPALHEVHAELGDRSARLMALRTTPKP